MMASSNLPAVGKFMPSGYEYEFVGEVPKEYNCTICFCPMWRPVLTKCGHRFCKDCLKEANKRKNPHQCPEDRQELRKQDVFEDKATERQILSLTIKCPSDGCRWIGELGDLTIIKMDHTCTPTGTEHKNGQTVKKEKVTNHQTDERSLTLLPCVYQRFGCNFKTARKDMDKHIADNIGYHFSITSERLMLLENENHQLKQSQIEVEQQYQSLKTSIIKEKEEREAISKELTNLNTTIRQKWVRLDKNLQILNSQNREFSKEIKDLRKQIKHQTDEETKTSKTSVNAATINKDLAEKIERSRLRMETSIDELRHDFHKKMKETQCQLKRDLDEQTRRTRYQMLRSDFENVDRKTKINTRVFQRYVKDRVNKLMEEHDAKRLVSFILLCAIFFFVKKYKKELAALLLEI